MQSYHIILTSLNTINYIYVMDYIRDDLNIIGEEYYFYKSMMLTDLPSDYSLSLFVNEKINNEEIDILATEENVIKTNKIFHSYFINKLFPFVAKEEDIDLFYDEIVDPKDICSSYFRPEVNGGSIHMAFQIAFRTRDTYNRFKLKYPRELHNLNFFNQVSYKCI